MAIKVAATLTATDNTGAKVKTNISNVNPEATNTTVKNFAQMLNSLTTNSYVQTAKTISLICDTDQDITPTPSPTPTPSEKLTPTLTLENASATMAEIFAAMQTDEGLYENPITYNGDGVLSVATSYADIVSTVDQDFLYVSFIGEGTTGTVTLYASEGTEYAAASVTFTITAS